MSGRLEHLCQQIIDAQEQLDVLVRSSILTSIAGPEARRMFTYAMRQIRSPALRAVPTLRGSSAEVAERLRYVLYAAMNRVALSEWPPRQRRQ